MILLLGRDHFGSAILYTMLKEMFPFVDQLEKGSNHAGTQGYVAAMSTMIEAIKEQVWKDVMAKEYESIVKNDVWDVVPRPNGKFVMTSKRLLFLRSNMELMPALRNTKQGS